MRKKETKLFFEPEAKFFRIQEEEDFASYLKAKDKFTISVPIDSTKSILLNDNGFTESGKLLFSLPAFSQITGFFCHGLFPVISNLIGTNVSPKLRNSKKYSVKDAINIYNTIARVKFDNVNDKNIIRNAGEKTIDGIVGRTYTRIPNVDVYNISKDILKSSKKFSFNGSFVLGGCASIVYLKDTSSFSCGVISEYNNLEDNFYIGLCISNSETGNISLRISPIIVREFSNTKFLCPPRRKSHRGRNLRKSFVQAITEESSNLRLDIEQIKNSIIKSKNLLLGFSTDDHNNDKCFKKLVTFLKNQTSQNITNQLAQNIIRSTLIQGSGDYQPVSDSLEMVNRRIWAKRTYYDLAIAISREAEKLVNNMDLKQKLEQVSYKILSNRK